MVGQDGEEKAEKQRLLHNRLSESRSPYVSPRRSRHSYSRRMAFNGRVTEQVRGHMNNPVAWQMWNADSLALAKKHNRLLFVSIGYAACHCRSKALCSSYIVMMGSFGSQL